MTHADRTRAALDRSLQRAELGARLDVAKVASLRMCSAVLNLIADDIANGRDAHASISKLACPMTTAAAPVAAQLAIQELTAYVAALEKTAPRGDSAPK